MASFSNDGVADPTTLAPRPILLSSSPNKKARTDDICAGGNAAALSELAQNNVMDSFQEAPQDEKQSQEDAAWEAVKLKIQSSDPNSSSFQHLQDLLDGVDRRQAKMQSLETVFHQVEANLEQTITCKLLGTVADMHGIMFENMESLEKSMERHLVQNHERRNEITSRLDQFNATWQSKYESFLHRVREGGDENNENFSANKETNDDVVGDIKLDSTNGGGTMKEEEPNWNELLEHEPSRAHVQAFLQGREQWQTAQERFGVALDEVHENLKTSVNKIFQSIVDAIEEMNESMDAQFANIRSHLSNNFERREFFESVIQETAKRHQSMFSTLMTRIGGSKVMSNLMNLGRSSKSDQEMHQK